MQQGHGAPSKPKPKSDKSRKSNVATKQSKDIIVTNDESCKVVSQNKTSTDYYNKSCPDSSSHGVEAVAVNRRSSCPWYTVLNHDSNRFPTDIVEAVCHHSKSCNHKLSQKESACEPIFFQVPVLVRCNFPNKKSKKFYAPSTQKIAVGCTCATTPAS